MVNSRIALINATLADGTVASVAITGSKISDIGPNAGQDFAAEEKLDCTGLRLLPGFVDMHTHLREPGFEQSETILSGSKAAAKGGFTAVHAMANTDPVADNAAVVEQVLARGKEAGYVDVFPVGAVTVGLRGEQLAELGSMADSKAQVRVFSDDGKCVHDALLMRRALEYVKSFEGVVAQHAQEPSLTKDAQMNEGAVSAELGLAGWPSMAESSIIARDVLIAKHVDSRVHICHVSTVESVEVIRWAKSQGIRVTAEVTPHHLILSDDLARGYNALYKVNPPLRTEADIRAVREGLVDGTIDIIATDHAPHQSEAKECEWAAAAFGMTGLEVAASVAQEVLIESGSSTWARLAEVLSINPAKIAGDNEHGQDLSVGAIANLVVIDPSAKRVIPAASESKSRNNPYVGMALPGKVVHTIFGGYLTVRDGELSERGRQ